MIKFGTGGWRAIIGDLFIRDNIRNLTGYGETIFIGSEKER